MKKGFKKTFLPLFALFMAPILLALILVFALPSVYEDTFLGELGEKFDRLTESEEKKIVVVGGSSVAFGLDSEMLQKETGYKAVNFGLYANLGTKLMMDLSKANVCEGDIYILAPEMNSQTLSLYFNGETAIQAIDSNTRMLRYVDSGDREALLGAMWGHMSNKVRYTLTGTAPENSGAYKKENFNEYGDNVYSRPYKEIVGYGNSISFDFGSEFDEFIDYVNEYTEYIRSKGGEVYFSFSPMNKDAVYSASVDTQINDFYVELCKRLDCRVISDIYSYILDGGYFFDSEFHLNDSGVVVRTVRLIDDIKRELGDKTVTLSYSQLPEPTGDKPDNDELILIKLKDGSGWAVSGLTDQGKSLASLVIPDEVSGLPVVEIRSGAFDEGELMLIQLGANIARVQEGAFDGADTLTALVIPDTLTPEELTLPEDMGSITLYGDRAFESYGYAMEDPEYFTSLTYTEGNETYRRITGLSELGKLSYEITLPEKIRGRVVKDIAPDSFKEATLLREINLGKLDIFLLPVDELKSLGIKVRVTSQDYAELIKDPKYESVIVTDNIYFKLAENDDGTLTVVGLTEAGMAIEEARIPEKVDGKSVRVIAENAFAGSKITTLYVSKSVSRLDGRAFANSSITTVVMPEGVAPDRISVPNNMSQAKATDGALGEISIFVPDEYYEAYAADYFWGDYGSMLRRVSEMR